jgi:GntR family transcriptional regulator
MSRRTGADGGRRSRLDRARRVRDMLRSQVLAHDFGGRFPAEEELAREYQVSRNTVREALTMLVGEGVLRRRRGIGTSVVNDPLTRAYDCGRGLSDSISGGRQRTAHRTITMQLVPAVPLLRGRFGGAESEFVFWEHLTYLDGRPNATWSSYLPGHLAAPLLTHPRRDDLGLDEAFAELPGVRPDRTRRIVQARLADPRTAVLLEVEPDSAVLHIERSIFAHDGSLIELGYGSCRGERYAVSYESYSRSGAVESTTNGDAYLATNPAETNSVSPDSPFTPGGI